MFLFVLGGLVAFTFIIMVAAGFIGGSLDEERSGDPMHIAAIERRVAPVGRVRISGDEPAGEQQAAAAPVATAPPASAPAAPATEAAAVAAAAAPADADLAHGEKIYQSACLACHMSGAAGAPKLGDVAAWEPRMAQGADAMLNSVINGKGAMPAKGGRVDLSDGDVAAAMAFMVSKVQ